MQRAGGLTSRLEPTETVLVVEDEVDIATFMRAYFRASGTDVVHLDPTTPDDVADAVDTHKPTCVLLDLNLRGFSGIEAFRRIRDAGSSLPVIVVTADSNPATHRAALNEGVDERRESFDPALRKGSSNGSRSDGYRGGRTLRRDRYWLRRAESCSRQAEGSSVISSGVPTLPS